MKNSHYDRIVENLIMFLPLYRAVFLKMGEKGKCVNILKSQYPVLGVLSHRGPMPMSELGDLLGISKSNMTALIDHLIEEKKVVRMPDKDDRRIIRIAITEKGRSESSKAREIMKEEFKRRLSVLVSRDVEKLSNDLENIRSIISKISLAKVKQ